MFDVEEFMASCQAALKEHSPELAAKELMARTMAHPLEVVAALGTPRKGEVITLHHSPDLTVLNVIWAPHMSIFPHDHQLWARPRWRCRPNRGHAPSRRARTARPVEAATNGSDPWRLQYRYYTEDSVASSATADAAQAVRR